MIQPDQHFKLAAHAWLSKDSKFLVVRRSFKDDFMPGYWDIPGGCLDFGEDPVNAAIRESKEEVGLEVKANKLLYCHNQVYGNKHWFILIYQCEIINDNKITLDPNEHCEFRWVTLQELQQLPKIDFLVDFFQNYLQKKA